MKKPYQRIDVNVYKEILKNKFCPDDEKGSSKKVLLEMLQQINKFEIKIEGLNIDIKKELGKINFREFGFKERADVKIEFKEEVFDDNTKIVLKPKTIYELEDNIELPKHSNNKQKQYLALMADTFERIKIKAENILEETNEHKHIEMYANKNIQKILRIFYEAITVLTKLQKNKDNTDRFFVYVQTIFIMNSILYYQSMFSAYHKEKDYSKKTLKIELYDSVGPDLFMEPVVEYGKQVDVDTVSEHKKIKLKGNINVLITAYYDLMKAGILEDDPKAMEDYIFNTYLNKNGNPISRYTINTCLKEYRTEKRVTGTKRIKIPTYLQELD